MFTPTVADILHFLTEQYNTGMGFSAMNSVRSALSTFISVEGQPMGSHPLVRRFIKGVFNLRPALPKNETVWDTSVVLAYLKKLSPVRNLDFKFLTLKLVMLMALLTGQRAQTLHSIKLNDLIVSKNALKIKVSDLLKHSRPGKHLHLLTIKAYAPDRRLCIITVLYEYLKRTKEIRKHDKLFVGTIKPHGQVAASTISRWIKSVLYYSGIDTRLFSAHSTRGASTSKAMFDHVPITTILNTAGWSREETFATYYNKPITTQGGFSDAILRQ